MTMRLETLRIDDIHPYERNPRKNDNAVDAVKESIRQCGYVTPIIVDEDHVIIAGHTRFKALVKLGEEMADCLVCDNLAEDQKKKYRYLDNKTGEKAVWDLVKLEIELDGIDLGQFDFFGTDAKNETGTGAAYDAVGATEINMEEYANETFKYQCPKCGFRFN